MHGTGWSAERARRGRVRALLAGRRLRLLAVPALVLAAVELTAAPAAGETSAAAGETSTAAVAAPTCDVPAPTTAAGYQAMFDALSDATWSGGDQAASVVLRDGRVLWLFGDTLRGEEAPDGGYAPGVEMVRNSMLVQDGGCLTAVPGPDGAEVIPTEADGTFFWPLQALLDDGHLVVLAQRVVETGDGPWDFRTAGMSAAVFDLASGTPRLTGVTELPASSADERDPAYGVSAMTVDGFHYLYGTAKVDRELVFGKAVHLARVPVGELLSPGAWQYWAGSGWVGDPASAAPVVPAEHGWSTSFSVHPRPDGSFRMVTKEHDVLGTDIITGTASTPAGPFTRTVVTQRPSYATPGDLAYNALAHPSAALADGHLLVSYSRNNEDLAVLADDADHYKPQFLSTPR